MLIPGRYYWLSLSSSPHSPPIEESRKRLFKWLHRTYPYARWIWARTSEGYGVLHMIVRIPWNELNIDVDALRAYWVKTHHAHHLNIQRVKDPVGLAAYLSDQRDRKALAGEVAWQDQLERWFPGRNWLPVGFTRAWGRFWFNGGSELPEEVRVQMVMSWLIRCEKDVEQVQNRPYLDETGTWREPEVTDDKTIEKEVSWRHADVHGQG